MGQEVSKMISYKKLYTTLFNHVTDAIDQLDAMNYSGARELLVKGQQMSEALYINGGRTSASDDYPQPKH